MAKIFIILLSSLSLYAHINEAVLYDFEARCMICHDTYKQNDKAPPLIAINQVYLKLHDHNHTIARAKIKVFLTQPTHEKALMKPAIELYGLMPKISLDDNQTSDFAEVLIETEFEIPEWFEKHYKLHKLKKPHEENEIK
ncbi:MAG: hypothetical protein U9N49_10420 [Campylobacterota bacterium]|nr:hypothetical protein [Campylobacterota bacterium]